MKIVIYLLNGKPVFASKYKETVKSEKTVSEKFKRTLLSNFNFWLNLLVKVSASCTVCNFTYEIFIRTQNMVVHSAVFTAHLVYACVLVLLFFCNCNSLIMRRELTSIN